MNDRDRLYSIIDNATMFPSEDIDRAVDAIVSGPWIEEHDREVIANFVKSLEYEYAQGFETDYYDTWYVGKSFGHESNRPIDEGYTLIKRGLLPWEKAEEEN